MDAASHQPIKKAVVSILYTGIPRGGGDGGRTQNQDQQAATTDASGKNSAFDNLPAGQYQVIVMHQNYPQARMGGVHKSVQGLRRRQCLLTSLRGVVSRCDGERGT